MFIALILIFTYLLALIDSDCNKFCLLMNLHLVDAICMDGFGRGVIEMALQLVTPIPSKCILATDSAGHIFVSEFIMES